MSESDRRTLCFAVGMAIGIIIGILTTGVIVRVRDINRLSEGHFIDDGKLYKIEYVVDEDDFKKRLADEWHNLTLTEIKE